MDDATAAHHNLGRHLSVLNSRATEAGKTAACISTLLKYKGCTRHFHLKFREIQVHFRILGPQKGHTHNLVKLLPYLKNVYLFSFIWKAQREKERQTDLPSTGSLYKCPNSQGWAKLKPATENSTQSLALADTQLIEPLPPAASHGAR